MNFVLLVNASPHSRQAANSARHFARAACERGHRVSQVFFYGDGVLCGDRCATPAADEADSGREWADLARDHDIDLVLCVAAAQRRGVLDADEAKRLGQAAPNLADGFRLGGLGQWVEASSTADRMLSFGD